MESLKGEQSIFILSYSIQTTAKKKGKQKGDRCLRDHCWENFTSGMDVWILFLPDRFREAYEIGLMRHKDLAVGTYQPA